MKDYIRQTCAFLETDKALLDQLSLAWTSIGQCDHEIVVNELLSQHFLQVIL